MRKNKNPKQKKNPKITTSHKQKTEEENERHMFVHKPGDAEEDTREKRESDQRSEKNETRGVFGGVRKCSSKAKQSKVAAPGVDGPRGLHNNDDNNNTTTTNINNDNNNSTSLYQRNNKAPGGSLVPPMTPIPCASRNPCRSAKPCALTGVYKFYLRRSPPSVSFFFFWKPPPFLT